MSPFSLNGVLNVPAKVRVLGLQPAVPAGGAQAVEKNVAGHRIATRGGLNEVLTLPIVP
jgi:hypothetical protein